jgi:hypothetical protein
VELGPFEKITFFPPDPLSEPVSMLPISKDRVAMQQCVGEHLFPTGYTGDPNNNNNKQLAQHEE